MYLLGVDIGTSGTKTVLFDLEGRTVASASREYGMVQEKQGWAEQDPEDWWRAARDTIATVIANSGVDARAIKGIGLSGQMHGMVLLDKDHKLLRPAIIWCDQRTQKECDEITAVIGAKRLIEITANPALTGFTASKILWVKRHQPEIYEKIRHILLPKDYVRLRLTGELATEVSDASGMQLLDVPKRRWSNEMLDQLEIGRDWLAPVYESPEISGRVTETVARQTGLAVGTPVAGGAGDQAASAVGNGIVKRGVVSSTLGTSGVVFAYTDEVSIDPKGRVHTFCHAVPGKWHIMGVTQSAGLSLQWFRNQFGQTETDMAKLLNTDPYVLMDKEAALAAPGCDGLLYLPYLMGERTPHLDAQCRGAFVGLTARHTRRDMLRAVMEGVGYSLLDCMSIIREMGVEPGEVRAAGGGGRSLFWRQMQADLFGTEVTTVNTTEGGALGVAILAGVGVGLYSGVPEACEAVIHSVTHQLPGESAATYQRYYPVYQGLYGALKPSFDQLATLA